MIAVGPSWIHGNVSQPEIVDRGREFAVPFRRGAESRNVHVLVFEDALSELAGHANAGGPLPELRELVLIKISDLLMGGWDPQDLALDKAEVMALHEKRATFIQEMES